MAIARAFITQPKILFADEPTGNLDEENAKQVVDLLFGINGESRTTLILITHNVELARMADRILEMKGGRVVNDKIMVK